ncbi:Trafficking protein particle complex subunit 6B [Pleurostoma richardsiae]|uniref:Trafficking protein particle complex subunit 6B n=1 Tax=Pleurostoma richardsiae TaxID=41990 RepID=A0AA38VIN1_9PEZI|nr:Trafficking protein particle complex subunit 6B [Pleurostoma richardsiae]
MSFDNVMPPYNASDPHATFLSSSCLDFLLIELVPMAYRITNELEAASAASSAEDDNTPPPLGADRGVAGSGGAAATHGAGGGPASSTAGAASTAGSSGVGGGPGSARRLDEEEERDAVFFRLETLGYRVGQGLVERFSRDRPRFSDTLDVIKFLCKDLWTLVFRKQVDNLKTNHRGVYVLTDNSFRPFSRMSTETGGQAVTRATPFLWFPCGIVRGALAALGINATVHAETSELPGAVFQIKTVPAK